MADSADDEVSEEQAERLVLRTVAAVVAFLLAAGIVVIAQRADREESSDEPAVLGNEPATGFAGGEKAVGPLQGVRIDRYLDERARVLEDATGRRAAVVSFERYVTKVEAERLLADVEVRALLVAAPGGLPSPADDLEDWARLQRRTARQEREELERLLPTVEDAEFSAQYRTDIERLRRLEESVDPAGTVVFAAVVVADADDLRDLAEHDGTRLVDVAAGDDVPEGDDARGIRPEETAEAGEPPSRPL